MSEEQWRNGELLVTQSLPDGKFRIGVINPSIDVERLHGEDMNICSISIEPKAAVSLIQELARHLSSDQIKAAALVTPTPPKRPKRDRFKPHQIVLTGLACAIIFGGVTFVFPRAALAVLVALLAFTITAIKFDESA